MYLVHIEVGQAQSAGEHLDWPQSSKQMLQIAELGITGHPQVREHLVSRVHQCFLNLISR